MEKIFILLITMNEGIPQSDFEVYQIENYESVK